MKPTGNEWAWKPEKGTRSALRRGEKVLREIRKAAAELYSSHSPRRGRREPQR